MTDGNNQSKAGEFGEIPNMETMRAQKRAATELGAKAPDAKKEDLKPADGAENKEGFQVPDKFKDKSMEDVLTSYSNLESQLGRQAQEMGTLRTLNDQLLDLKTTGPAPAAETIPEVTADDVLNNPAQTITTIAKRESHVAVDQTNTRVDQLEATLALSVFEGRHPDYQKDQQDPKFQAFVQGSNYRSALAQKVVGGDLAAGEELWSAWDEVRGENKTTQLTAEEIDAQETAAALALRGGGEGSANLPKAVSRAELSRIRIEEEDRYYSPEFQEYVQFMYKNKLVK